MQFHPGGTASLRPTVAVDATYLGSSCVSPPSHADLAQLPSTAPRSAGVSTSSTWHASS
jgi:hypothetical protein